MIKTGTLTKDSVLVSELKRTDDLDTSLFLYGTGIPVETKIASVINSTSLNMTKIALGAGSIPIEFSPAHVGVYHERNCALLDAEQEINERGEFLTFMVRTESNVSRDRYNSIKKRNQSVKYMMRAYPITFNPNERQLEKAGIREKCDVIIYTALKTWNDLGLDFENDIIAEKMTVKMRGANYEIKNKGLSSQMADTFLYITFGIFKR